MKVEIFLCAVLSSVAIANGSAAPTLRYLRSAQGGNARRQEKGHKGNPGHQGQGHGGIQVIKGKGHGGNPGHQGQGHGPPTEAEYEYGVSGSGLPPMHPPKEYEDEDSASIEYEYDDVSSDEDDDVSSDEDDDEDTSSSEYEYDDVSSDEGEDRGLESRN